MDWTTTSSSASPRRLPYSGSTLPLSGCHRWPLAEGDVRHCAASSIPGTAGATDPARAWRQLRGHGLDPLDSRQDMPQLTPLLADWVDLNSRDSPGQAYADALLRACQGLSDEVLRRLPATPDDAAAALANAPFADRVEGIYLPWDWFEPYSTAGAATCGRTRRRVGHL